MARRRDSSDEVKKSIVTRTGLALVGISFTALLSMFGSMMVAETLEGAAAAINLSGSMRMQSYRLANEHFHDPESEKLQALIREFELKLESPLLRHVIKASQNEDLEKAALKLHQEWHEAVKPALFTPTIPYDILMPKIDTYVAQIDNFVRALEESSESKIRLLIALQGITMFVVILISFLLLYRIHENVALPLRDLVAAARRIKSGDFSAKSHYNDEDELGLLANTFNQMSEDLSVLYKNLENRVAKKTEELQRSNDSLRILYETSRKLYSNPSAVHQKIHAILHELQNATGLGTISLCLSKQTKGPSYQLITSSNIDRPSFCQMPNCDQCRSTPDKTEFAPHLREVVSFPVSTKENPMGEITVEVEQKQHIEDWQRDLLNAMADIVATTLTLSNFGEHEARLALMEERAVIARELHDSLAQSLSYQKLQAARLKRLLEKSADREKIFEAINEVQEGLNVAYKQLRELLSTFRMKIEAPGLEPALIGTVAEFRERSPIKIELDYGLAHCPLTPNEEIHCLQIVREAVSNAVKHSHAAIIKVSLEYKSDGFISIEIQDNGIGIPVEPHKQNHYGLAILAERADSLRGTLNILRRSEGGTLVALNFKPNFSITNEVPVAL